MMHHVINEYEVKIVPFERDTSTLVMKVSAPPCELRPSMCTQNTNVEVADDELYVPSDNGTYSVHPEATPSSLHAELNVTSIDTTNSQSEAMLTRGVTKSNALYV